MSNGAMPRGRVAAAALLMAVALAATAEGTATQLFKVISARDEVTVGFAREMDAERAAKLLLRDGYLRAWQYGPARNESGTTVQKPQQEILILGAQVVRIEPVVAVQPVVPPPH